MLLTCAALFRGVDVRQALPHLTEVTLRGNPAFSGKPTAEVYTLRQIYEQSDPPVRLVVGPGPLFEQPQPMPKARAYTSLAPGSMRSVSDEVRQSEFGNLDDPDLWNILDSSEEEEEAEDRGAVEPVEAPVETGGDEGGYRTAADMRAAYAQLRHALSHPEDFMRHPRPRRQPKGGGASHGLARFGGDARADRSSRRAGATISATAQAEPTLEQERLASMEAMLAKMKERASIMEEELGTAQNTLSSS